ncbi:MAG: PAS domain-containing protein [Verrucomicrobia bacterium]|nr:PAS domain-containing protein [Verrucomicrobiota bacterium]
MLTLTPVCIVYSQDADLVRRVKAYARSMAQVRHVAEPDRLEAVLEQSAPAVVLMDLRARECRDLMEQLERDWPDSLQIALGTPRSEPLRDAENSPGIYAAEDLQLERRPFQALIGRAFDYLKLMRQNRDLQEAAMTITPAPLAPSTSAAATESRAHSSTLPLLRLPRVFRKLENAETLLAGLVENVADAAGVTRVGIFSRIRQGDKYRLRAGLHCLPETHEIEYSGRDPFVRWFETHAHLIWRPNLPHITDMTQRALLRRALDSFGAEVIVPLYGRTRIIGWIFFGYGITGVPFDQGQLERLMILAEHVATMVENALLYEEITLQKTMAETLLKNIPPAIVAIDDQGMIRWFNASAETILGVRAADALGHAAEAAGHRVAMMLRDALDSTENADAQQWIDPRTRRSLSVEVRRLGDPRASLGAVAVIHDVTMEENLRQKQELVDRAAFWTDLAASMSHEIRNPLVAIKTFAQLLPERFDDADFRKSFSDVVVNEVERLDKIVSQINTFAHPGELKMQPLDIREPVRRGVELARSRLSGNGEVTIEAQLPPHLPKVVGDENALAEAFAHLVTNAAEAARAEKKPKVMLTAKQIREGTRDSAVLVTVQDNGRGIAPEMKDKMFSPFATTKPRGMGLGLPIVKRTVFDHNGSVDIESTGHGTAVNVALPVSENGG